MRFVWLSAKKDLQRRLRDPLALIGWVGIPLVMTALLHFVFSGDSATPRGLLLVADEDNSVGSQLVTSTFKQGRLAEMITVENVQLEEGRGRIQKGDGSALLIIPKGFGLALLRGDHSQLQLFTNPSQRILPAIIEETLSILSDGAFYLQLVAGEQLRILAQGPPDGRSWPDVAVALFSTRVNRLVNRLRAYLTPPLIGLDSKVIEQQQPMRMDLAFFPGMLFVALLFMAQGLSADIWREQTQGTLRRAAASPRSIQSFLAGKLLAIVVQVVGVGVLGLTGGLWLLRMQVARPILALLWLTFSGAALYLLMTLIQIHASTPRTGNILTTVVLFPLALIGGSFFPFEMMPAGMAAIGRNTPNGWAVVHFKAMLAGSIQPDSLAIAFTGLLAVGTAAFWLASRRLRRMV